MTLTAKIQKVRDALKTISSCSDIYHYFRQVQKTRYIIWAEDSEDSSFHSDNHKSEQVIHGTVDAFTKIEYDEMIDEIQDALDSNGISYRLNSVQFEDDTNFIHYEWEWEV